MIVLPYMNVNNLFEIMLHNYDEKIRKPVADDYSSHCSHC